MGTEEESFPVSFYGRQEQIIRVGNTFFKYSGENSSFCLVFWR